MGKKATTPTEISNRYDLLKWSQDANPHSAIVSLRSELERVKASVSDLQEIVMEFKRSNPQRGSALTAYGAFLPFADGQSRCRINAEYSFN